LLLTYDIRHLSTYDILKWRLCWSGLKSILQLISMS